MIQHISQWLARRIVASGEPDEFDVDWVIYWLEKKIGQTVTAACLLVIGLSLGNPVGAVVYFLFLLRLKGPAGGLHAKTQFRCTAVSTLGFLIPQLVFRFPITVLAYMFHALALISALLIFFIAPADNPKEHLTNIEVRRYKVYARITLVIEGILCVILILLKAPLTILVSAYSAIIVVAITLIVPKQ